MFVFKLKPKGRFVNNKNLNVFDMLKAGNEQAFDIIYKQYYNGLCAFASQYIPLNECEEVVQDAMMWLWENRSSLLSDMSLKSLLFTIVKNKCLNRISHQKVKQEVHEKLFAKFEEQFEDPDFYVLGELLELIEKSIQELPDDYKEAFVLNRFENLTYNEIAEKTGMSSKTIAYRTSQALKILRVKLKDYLPLLIWLLN